MACTKPQCLYKGALLYLYTFICLLAVHGDHLNFIKIRPYLPIIIMKSTISFSGKTLPCFELQQASQDGDLARCLSERRLLHSDCRVNI